MRVDGYPFRGLRSRLLTTAVASVVCSFPASAASLQQEEAPWLGAGQDGATQIAMAIGNGGSLHHAFGSGGGVLLPVADTAPADEAEPLIERGDQLLELGDPASARLFYELAASKGSARAATGMGKTFDPAYFAKLGIRGGMPDPQKAITWYEKGSDAGDDEAALRLRELSLWLGLPVDLADPPIVEVREARGDEDSDIPLSIEAALTDTDGSETLSLVIAGLPEGASLSAGKPGADGRWEIEPTQLADLRLTPPADFSGQFDLVVKATSHEQDGDSRITTGKLSVTVAAVGDEPDLRVEDAVGEEGVPLALAIATALRDQDGSESLVLDVTGLPEGMTLSAGQAGESGSWILQVEDLDGLMLTAPVHYSGNFPLAVNAKAVERDGTESAVVSKVIDVAFTGIADTPRLEVKKAEGTEDEALALQIEAELVDTDGSESLSIDIAGLPEGASLSAGAAAGIGGWNLSSEDLAGLTLTPPANFAGSFELLVNAEASESDGSSVSASQPLQVVLASAADEPRLTVQAASGPEGEPIPLDIAAELVDTDGSESLTITVGGLPEGAKLSAGQTLPNGDWELAPEQLEGLTLAFAELTSGDFELTVTATARETEGATASSSATLAVSALPVAQQPILEARYAGGQEDGATPLSIETALLDKDGSEKLSITVEGLPEGATLSAGGLHEDGSWRLTPEELDDLTLSAAPNFSGRFVLTVKATAQEENGDSATEARELDVWVAGVADVPDLTVEDVVAEPGQPVPLSISASLHDQDGSESLEITIAGMPEGAALSAGRVENDGAWHLAPEDLRELTLTPAEGAAESFELVVNAIASEQDGANATTTDTLGVTFASEVALAAAAEPAAPPAAPPSTPEPAAAAEPAPEATAEPAPAAALPETEMAKPDEEDTFGIQLSSVRTKEAALREASRLRQRHFDLLAGLDFEVEEADIEGQGIFYRVFAGAFFNHTTAEDICGQIEFVEPEQYCLVVRRNFDGRQLASTAVVSDVASETALDSDALDSQLVTAVQLQLKDAGYGILRANGELDPDTSASIKAYQATHKLNVDGKPTPALLEHLVAQKHALNEAPMKETMLADASGGQRGGITIPIGSLWADAQEPAPDVNGASQASEEQVETAAEPAPSEPETAASEPESEGDTAAPQLAARSAAADNAAPSPADAASAASPEIAMLMERGDELLRLGDPASARLFYELAADHGHAAAATAVAKTYDPLYLSDAGVKGVMADPAKALSWYEKAANGGDGEAVSRIDSLKSWVQNGGPNNG